MRRKREKQKRQGETAQSAGPHPLIIIAIILLAIIILAMLSAFIKVFVLNNNLNPDSATTAPLAGNGSISVFFCPHERCEERLLSALQQATTIHCAFYELNLNRTIKLLDEKNADVLVFEKEYEKFGTPIPSSGLMHDKFCILDNSTVITGSMNPTINDAYKNNNNLLVIESKALAQNYEDEFQELKRRAGKEKSAERPTQATALNISGIIIENYFCPDDGCEERVLHAIERANHSIRFMAFSFTADRIGDLLIGKWKANVSVQGVFEKRQLDDYTEYDRLIAAGLGDSNVRIDGNKYTMHHKVFIIDDQTVVTGSFNPTKNANERNDENILIIHDQRIAQEYAREFAKVFGNATTG